MDAREDARAGTRAAGKPARRRAKGDPPGEVRRRKHSIVLSDAAWIRLSVHATATGADRSELLERLIGEHCRRFVVSDRGGAGGGACEPDAV